ncbi:right-handed parallel beta-helix repeat-containing protein [Luteolibacter arcticus]|uniref:Right-handed parallel beta-helix repeat-containing protein n=1 Tax=Luteolibacter arcticus TaxID=1581411 RepID=A0ABT3GKN8_9BACT|nr:right-handed parallel beta-helix repeat-containing protein [Luteolibacter arcticus]MCW1924085.1 right-handed parallel beta-helix repeat-containing protein [Luteolibacter arcticus]
MIARLLFFLFSCSAVMALDDFRPMVAEAISKGEKKVIIPPGTYRLAPTGGGKCVWTLQGLKDVEIIADGVTLVSTKLTRAVAIDRCTGVSLRGLTVDYDPLPFTQGTVTAVAENKGWIEVKLHAGYPRQPYSRIDVVDPATRYRKKGMPFLWGTKAEMRGEDTVRVTLKDIGKAAETGTLASLNTGPAADGIPHAFSLERCSGVNLRGVTIHSAPGMGILECDGDGKTEYLACRVVPGPTPTGASEARLLSTSWDAMQTKTVRHGPRVEGCEIREAGDDSWSVQSSDFMVLKVTGSTLVIASRDEFTVGVESGDRLKTRIGGPDATITSRRELSREKAALDPAVTAKLKDAPQWSEWRVSPKCLEVTLDQALPVKAGDSLYSPDRMGNGFSFLNNRIHSSGRLLIKGAGRIEGNLLDTPHSIVVCPEIPGNAAAGIDGLVIRKNTIRRSGWFCAAPWSTQAGALSITAGGGAQQLRAPAVFANIVIEDNTFEDCSGPNLVISSAKGVKVRGNRFIRPHHDKPDGTGGSYGIASNAVIWTAQCEDVEMKNNPITEPGSFCGEKVVEK